MRRFVKELNHLYLSSPELWEIEDSWAGFGWIEAERSFDNVVIYNRYDTKGDFLTVIVNFSPVDRLGYVFKTDFPGSYEVLLNSDLYRFGGKNVFDGNVIDTIKEEYKTASGKIEEHIMRFDLAANSALILRRKPTKKEK